MPNPETPKPTIGEIMRLLMATEDAIEQLVAGAPEIAHDAKGRLRCPTCKFKPTPDEHAWSEIDWSVTVIQGEFDWTELTGNLYFDQDDATRETLAFGCANCGQVGRFAESVDVLWG